MENMMIKIKMDQLSQRLRKMILRKKEMKKEKKNRTNPQTVLRKTNLKEKSPPHTEINETEVQTRGETNLVGLEAQIDVVNPDQRPQTSDLMQESSLDLLVEVGIPLLQEERGQDLLEDQGHLEDHGLQGVGLRHLEGGLPQDEEVHPEDLPPLHQGESQNPPDVQIQRRNLRGPVQKTVPALQTMKSLEDQKEEKRMDHRQRRAVCRPDGTIESMMKVGTLLPLHLENLQTRNVHPLLSMVEEIEGIEEEHHHRLYVDIERQR